MSIYFGISLDEEVLPLLLTSGSQYIGPQGLLALLEAHLGLAYPPGDNEHLRIEQYRQVLQRHLSASPGLFYQASFEADQFAAATNLLARRDELLLAGWDFTLEAAMPERLQCLAEVERILKDESLPLALAPGYADRFAAVLKALPRRELPLEAVYINEPLELLPCHFQRLFGQLQEKGIPLRQLEDEPPQGDTDLANLQRTLIGQKNVGRALQGDGSLLLIKGKRDADLAAFLGQLLKHNPSFRPAFLIPDKSRPLGHALMQEGLPSLGLLSASLARPTLQVLKLASVFFWEPIDPFKVMEFVSLAVKPLERELSNLIANQMARAPGLGGEGWRAEIARYFESMEQKAANDRSIDLKKIRYQYNFWFNRNRYDLSKVVPKEEVVEVFNYLSSWAYECFEEEGSKNNSLLILSDQAKRIVELLEALPEEYLTNLELERIVRTIYEPAPVQFRQRELGFLPYAQQPGAVISPVEDLIWWSFTQNEPAHFFARWYKLEQDYLLAREVLLQGPDIENARMLWQRKRPILQARRRLLLLLPETVEGQQAHPHPLLGDLTAAFESLAPISIHIEQANQSPLAQFFRLPQYLPLRPRRLGRPQPFLYIRSADRFSRRDEETITSLETLLYYPYQWAFQHKIKLRKSSILSIVQERTLMGNLAHRLFEKLLREDIYHWGEEEVYDFIESQSLPLLKREGAVMLLYGKEPERTAFVQGVKYAAWSLVRHIKENGWRVRDAELPLQGEFLDIKINGRADLVLEKQGALAVVDLKWSGTRFREEIIRNEEDLQLVLYSKLLSDDGQWAYTAYYIMEKATMIARNKEAFQDLRAVAPQVSSAEANARIMAKMQATYLWRMGQIREGLIEIRCEQTRMSLEEAYRGDALADLLEMKNGDAPFDDYRVLINLIE
jgi:ATP-dependent helicase/nuclease subunit B